MTGALGLRTHYEEISRFLDFLPSMPDAFVCVSDYIAHFTNDILKNAALMTTDASC